MDGELKAIIITIVVFVVAACGVQTFYPGGVNALFNIFAK